MNTQTVKLISECFIKPKKKLEESSKRYYLSPLDLIFLPGNYMEYGLLFRKPKERYSMEKHLKGLKDSMALLLVHFYPLAGQLATEVDKQRHRCLIYVDCNKGPGVHFIYATLDVTVSNLLSPPRVPPIVKLLFDPKNGGIDYDSHTQPILSVQVTELVDGIFIGITINHMMVDGTSLWHFLKCWSEIYQAKTVPVFVSRPPILKRFLPQGYGPENLYFPYIHPDEFITRYQAPPYRECFFYFSSNTVQNLKAKANQQNNHQSEISSFQALLALVWRSIIKARGLPPHQITNLRMTVDNRSRLNPPLPAEYFGNAFSLIMVSTKVGELLENGLGWAAQLLHKALASHREKGTDEFFKAWFKSPFVEKRGVLVDGGAKNTIQVGGSHRSNVYKNEFGLFGRPIAVRTGNATKYDGNVYAHDGIEGLDSVELEVCLSDETMDALESDKQFMDAVSCSPALNRTLCRL